MAESAAGVMEKGTGEAAVLKKLDAHDAQQLDVELSYSVPQTGHSTYRVEMYLFVPREVEISPQNYGLDSFYFDLCAYLRLDNRPLPLGALADVTCPQSPLYHLNESLSKLEHDIHAQPERPIVSVVYLFGYSFAESIRTAAHKLRDELCALAVPEPPERRPEVPLTDGAEEPPERDALRAAFLTALDDFCRSGQEAVRAFRRMRRRFAPLCGARPAAVRESFDYIDEYSSFRFVEQLGELAQQLEAGAALHDGSCLVAGALSQLLDYGLQASLERRGEGFALPGAKEAQEAEFFTYRHALIKKSMQQSFYLEPRALRRDTYLRNAIAMVAAGLAAIWSLVAQVPTAWSSLTTQARLLVLFSAVLAYALKDRIKELSKDYLGRKLRKFDHDAVLSGESVPHLGLRGIEARVRERFTWLAPAGLPAAILRLRSYPFSEPGSDSAFENVIKYTRQVTLGRNRKVLSVDAALRDILRLNLQHFLARLADPRGKVSYYDLAQRRFLMTATPRVYHLNLLLRISGLSDGTESLFRRRIILNKERILRVEAAGPPRG
jgi:hypothetical protein